MESPPFKIDEDRDRISALPDELLLGILERLDLRLVVRAGAVSKRWRHLPHQLSRVDLDVDDFQRTTPLETMDAFAGVVCRLLSVRPPVECKCDCESKRAVKILRLRFYPSVPHLGSILRAVEETVSRGETDRFKFQVIPNPSDMIPELGQPFMALSRACPIAFRWLTSLSFTALQFRDSDLPSLISACDKLKHLSLRCCTLVGNSVFKMDVPNSIIHELEFINFRCTQIELVSVPKLSQLLCRSWPSDNPPLRFGYVPELLTVNLASCAKAWQAPFVLSKCFSMNTRSMSKMHISFGYQTIWIQPEHPKKLTAIFCNLTDVALWSIFPECDLSWTLFILEAAPALKMFTLDRARHSCVKTSEKTNVVWEPSKDLKHLNLQLLVMIGFEEEDKVTNYIRLVMGRATRLKRIKLQSYNCEACNKIDLESPRISHGRYQADEASKHQIKERLTHGSSSSVEIMIC